MIAMPGYTVISEKKSRYNCWSMSVRPTIPLSYHESFGKSKIFTYPNSQYVQNLLEKSNLPNSSIRMINYSIFAADHLHWHRIGAYWISAYNRSSFKLKKSWSLLFLVALASDCSNFWPPRFLFTSHVSLHNQI